MDKIAAALVKAQKAFAPALKTSTNPHFRSKYASLDACIEAVIDALNNNGIYLSQKQHDCDDGVKVETVFMHESGETFSSGVLHVPASKHDAQGYGSALTYARRYSLMAACGIAPEDDDGNAAKPADAPRQLPNIKEIVGLISNAADLESLKGHFTSAIQNTDPKWHKQITDAKDKRKEQLTMKEAA